MDKQLLIKYFEGVDMLWLYIDSLLPFETKLYDIIIVDYDENKNIIGVKILGATEINWEECSDRNH